MTDALTLAPPALAPVIDRSIRTGSELVARVQRVREVMRDLMEENVHYGRVPGTPRPSLWKPGAELLLMTFQIGPRLDVTDLSTADEIRYRVKVTGFAQLSGDVLAEGIGEASTNEEKYRWRGAVHDKEWGATPADKRRIKYLRDGKEIHQVRTSPADLANTVLLMAVKRGTLNMTRVVTACSDIFDQDLEDLPEELVHPATPSEFKRAATSIADQYAPPPVSTLPPEAGSDDARSTRRTIPPIPPRSTTPAPDPDPDADARDAVEVHHFTSERLAALAPGVVLVTQCHSQKTANPNVIRTTITVAGGPSWPLDQTRVTTIKETFASRVEAAWHAEQAIAITVTKGRFGFELASVTEARERAADPLSPPDALPDRGEDPIPF